MENRIGSHCWYLPLESLRNKTFDKWRAGIVRMWGTEQDGDNSVFPIAVIEDEKTLLCKSVYVENICFASVPPTTDPRKL